MQATRDQESARRASYDFWLILATVLVLFALSGICIGAMFAFKWAGVDQMAPGMKAAYMEGMNRIVAPFVVLLVVLLGICIPKRLLPVRWLNRFAVVLLLVAAGTAAWQGVRLGLFVVVAVSLLLQLVVLGMALAGSRRLYFVHAGYWLRVGSSLLHLGLVLFLLDLFLFRLPAVHLALFWCTTAATVAGMVCCFWSPAVAGAARRLQGSAQGRDPTQ